MSDVLLALVWIGAGLCLERWGSAARPWHPRDLGRAPALSLNGPTHRRRRLALAQEKNAPGGLWTLAILVAIVPIGALTMALLCLVSLLLRLY